NDVSLNDYLGMIRLKTAILLGTSLQIGALCGGAPPQVAEGLYNAGTSLGIAFQIQDDLLDVFGDSEVFGKQAGGDILAGKKTCLKLLALEKADDTLRAELLNWYAKRDGDAQKKVQA